MIDGLNTLDAVFQTPIAQIGISAAAVVITAAIALGLYRDWTQSERRAAAARNHWLELQAKQDRRRAAALKAQMQQERRP